MAGENNAEWNAFKKKVKSILGGTTTVKTNNIALPTVRQGDSCPEVKTLQFLLISHGEDCGSTKADGIFGSKTAAALKSYQQKVFGTADCICGKNTWTKLLREWK